MKRAIALSRRGFPAPNPHVGCVIVKDDRIVGEGFHDHAGAAHAEVMALKDARGAARGAEAFVTLEPCNHHGRTPPCVDALLEAGVRRVVVATPDPNPRAAGGLQRLEASGIEVLLGVMQQEAARENRMFLSAIRRGRPYVVGKAATSLDGRIALPSGESQWITGTLARQAGHRLRAECGAVLVGRATVEKDNPRLTARIPGVVNQPLRVVIDPSNRISPSAQVFSPEAETWHITGTVDLPDLLARLAGAGHIGLLVEGGPHTLSRFIEQDLVDELRVFMSSKLLGAGPNWLQGLPAEDLAVEPRFRFQKNDKARAGY